jgi:hypothetical protein
MAQPDRLPSRSLICGRGSIVDRSTPHAPLRPSRWFPADGAAPSRRHPGAPHIVRQRCPGAPSVRTRVHEHGSCNTIVGQVTLPADGAAPSRRHPGAPHLARQRCPGAPSVRTRVHEHGSCNTILGQLTLHQSLARTDGVPGSMRSWESARPRRRQGVPRSHGPAEETLNDQEVNFRLTADGLCGAPPRRGTRWPTTTRLSRSTAGRGPGTATVLGSPR